MKYRRERGLNIRKLLDFLWTIVVIIFFSCMLDVKVEAASVIGSITTTDGLKYYLYDDEVASVASYSGTEKNLTIPSVVSYNGKTYTVKYIAGWTSSDPAFYDNDSLETVTLPDTILGIGNGAFRDCGNLKKINLPEGMETIKEVAFASCDSLSEVTLPSTLTTLENSAFTYTAIKSVTIPAGLTDLGTSVFVNCSSLEEVTLPDNMTTIPDEMFMNCTSLTDLSFLENVTTIGTNAFSGCTALTEFNLPAGVATIGDKAFARCENIKTVVIPDGVTTIGTSAFSSCTSLESVQMTNNVTSLGNRAFYGCSALTDICLSDNITSIGEYTFYECTSLETIELPNQIKSIGESAFNECRGLKYIVVPEGVTSIGKQAFYNCSGLEYMILPSTLETTGEYWDTVYDENLTKQLRVPAIFYPAGTKTPSGDGYGWVSVKASYEEKADGTISVTIDSVYEYAKEAIEISLPEDIGGKTISSIEYGANVSEQHRTVAITCTKHYAPQLSFNEQQHFYEVCSICKEAKVNAQAHSYGDGSKKCICGYVPFSLDSSAKSEKVVYGYTDTIALEAAATATIGTEVITYQWYENGKAVNGATAASYKLPTDKKVGEYTYYCKVSSGGYGMESASRKIEITKKPITIRVDDVQRKQGEENPTFTYTVTEGTLVEGDTTDEWKVALTTTATKDSPAGTYKITGTITSDSYEVTVEDGVLTVEAVEESDTTGGSNQDTSDKGTSDQDTLDKDTSNQDSTGNTDDTENQNSFIDKESKAEYTIVNDGKNNTVIYEKSCDIDATTIVVPVHIVVGDKTYKVTHIAKNAFRNNKKLTKVTIGSNIIAIGDNAFRGCTNLKTVVIGKNVRTIGKNVFYGCKRLKTVKMGKSVVTIGDKAFYKCTSLTTITIPSKVKKIGKSAFEGCKKLKKITIKTKLLKSSKVGKKAFKGIKKNATIKVPKKKYKNYKKFLKKKGVSKNARFRKN